MIHLKHFRNLIVGNIQLPTNIILSVGYNANQISYHAQLFKETNGNLEKISDIGVAKTEIEAVLMLTNELLRLTNETPISKSFVSCPLNFIEQDDNTIVVDRDEMLVHFNRQLDLIESTYNTTRKPFATNE